MNRRQLVVSLGAIAAGGAAATGTGAFSSVEAQRNVDVTVAGDASSYLGIEPVAGGNGNYVDTTTNDALALSLTDSNGNIGDGIAGGAGLNANATTSIADVFQIKNQGTQTVEVELTPLTFLKASLGSGSSGLVSVFLVPQDPDEIELEFGWIGDRIAIKDLDPGQTLSFNVLAAVLGSGTIDEVSVNTEIEIQADAI